MIKKIDANKYGVVRYAISSIEDIADLPREVSVGSEAILVNEDGEKKFRLGSDGWVEVVEVKEYDEDKLRDILEDAKVGYRGIEYETLEERLDKDFDNVYSVLDNRTYVEYEGCRITAKDSLNGLQKETVVKGRTLQNLVDKYNYLPNKFLTSCYHKKGMIKPNTTYTSVIYNYSSELLQIYINEVSFNYKLITVEPNRYRVDKLQSKETVETNPHLFKNHIAHELNLNYKVLFLEGDYTQTPLEELPFIEGIESVGDKSKNLFNPNNLKQTVLDLGKPNQECNEKENLFRCSIRNIPCKPNTEYTFKSDESFYVALGSIDSNNLALGDTGWRMSKDRCTYTTPSNAVELAMNFQNMTNTRITPDDVRAINLQLEEGSQVTPYEPYYDGYKISGKSCGKNLAKEISEENYVAKGEGEVIFENNKCIAMDKSGWASCFISGKETIKVKPNTIYYGEVECEEGSEYLSQMKLIYKCFDRNNNVISTSGTVTLSNNAVHFYDSAYNKTYEAFLPMPDQYKYVKFSSEVHSVKLIFRPTGSSGTITNTFKNILFVETDKQPTYEPYKESTYSYILDEPLRSLPNGVCDEIDLEKGVVTRRVGKVVLDGTNVGFTNISSISNTLTNCMCFGISSTNWDKPMISNPTCDTTIVSNVPYIVNNEDVFHWRGSYGTIDGVDYGTFMLFIEKTKLTTLDSVGVNEWLSKNNIEVVYQLLTPTTEYLIKDDKFVTLPNGVKDEAGRIVTRNVGKVVLNGSEKWTSSTIENENHIKFFTHIKDENGETLKVDNAPIVSPTFPVIGCGQNSGDLGKYSQDIEGLYTDTAMCISVAKNRLETEDSEGLKKWLSQNPITVYYQLVKPYMECSYEKYPTLPNGVKDEISHNSVLRKVGKIVLDGSQVFETATGVEGIVRWGYYVPQAKIGGSCICSMFDYIAPVQTWWKPFKDGITVNSENSHIFIYMDKYKEAGQHVEEVRALLDGLEVYYELETPYTEPINLDEVILDTTRLKSYEPITHITSDNYLPPAIKTQVPSDFNAVVLGLKNNNEALTSQVMSLRQTNDELEATNREQDDVIDVTLLALDEVYGMIDEGEIETMSTGSPMVNVYVKMIKRGIKTLDEVPAKYRAEVEELI